MSYALKVKKIYLWFILIVLVGCTASPTSAPIPVSGNEQEQSSNLAIGSRPLIVGYIPQGSYAPIFVALEKGYFAEQGLQVELQSFRTGSEAIAPVSLGQIDVMAGEPGPAFFNAVYQKLDIQGAMTLNQVDEDHNATPLVIRKELVDSGEVQSLTDLQGRKIAINNERGLTEYRLWKILDTVGMTIDDVEIVVIAFPDMLQALENEAIDAALMAYPLAATALSAGPNGEEPAGVTLPETQVPIDKSQGAIYYYGKNFLAPENRDIAVRFTIAVLKANRDLYGDAWREDDEIVAAISKYTNVSEESVRTGVAYFFDPNGEIYLEGFQDIQDYQLSRGYNDYTEPLPMDQVIDDSFRQEALEILGEFN